MLVADWVVLHSCRCFSLLTVSVILQYLVWRTQLKIDRPEVQSHPSAYYHPGIFPMAAWEQIPCVISERILFLKCYVLAAVDHNLWWYKCTVKLHIYIQYITMPYCTFQLYRQCLCIMIYINIQYTNISALKYKLFMYKKPKKPSVVAQRGRWVDYWGHQCKWQHLRFG
jgi:hypothetical protein